jgi:hypothetical protein
MKKRLNIANIRVGPRKTESQMAEKNMTEKRVFSIWPNMQMAESQ